MNASAVLPFGIGRIFFRGKLTPMTLDLHGYTTLTISDCLFDLTVYVGYDVKAKTSEIAMSMSVVIPVLASVHLEGRMWTEGFKPAFYLEGRVEAAIADFCLLGHVQIDSQEKLFIASLKAHLGVFGEFDFYGRLAPDGFSIRGNYNAGERGVDLKQLLIMALIAVVEKSLPQGAGPLVGTLLGQVFNRPGDPGEEPMFSLRAATLDINSHASPKLALSGTHRLLLFELVNFVCACSRGAIRTSLVVPVNHGTALLPCFLNAMSSSHAVLGSHGPA